MDHPFDLNRFVDAQQDVHEHALAEIRSGEKRSHWMWYVFPQALGLGTSAKSKEFGISGQDEAMAYLAHPVLGPRLLAIAEAALAVAGRTANAIFGSPDDRKLQSSATLFASVSPDGSVFHRILAKYYRGEHDARTLQLLGASTPRPSE